jgi:hypothetical protein
MDSTFGVLLGTLQKPVFQRFENFLLLTEAGKYLTLKDQGDGLEF